MSEVEVLNLIFAYEPEKIVLENINLQIPERDLVAVIGPNGGGKSTLFRLILGLLKPLQGKVLISGQHHQLRTDLVGYVPQNSKSNHHFPIKVGDVVALGSDESRRWGWGFSKEVKERSNQVLEEVGLSDFKNRSWQALSGGERQRVLIARAMMSKPRLLLLDEPSANLDLQSKTKLYDLLHRVNENTTVLVSTHDLGLVPHIAKSVATVNHFLHYHPRPEITDLALYVMCGSDVDHHCPLPEMTTLAAAS